MKFFLIKKLNICEFTKINLNYLNFLTPYVIRKITNRINMFILLY